MLKSMLRKAWIFIWRARIFTGQILIVFLLIFLSWYFFNLGHEEGMRAGMTMGGGEAAGSGAHAGHPADDATTSVTETAEEVIWTCSMHPNIRQKEPGKCPLCGMDLIPETASGGDGMSQLEMSEAARALAEIETVPVRREWAENEVRMVGLVDYDETQLVDVTAYVGGRLDRLYVDFTGVRVRKGDHMASVYSPELLTAQSELIQARAAYEKFKDSAVSGIRDTNRKALEASRERLRLWGITEEQIQTIEERGTREDHLTIYASREGVVIKKHLQEGAYASAGTPIYTIANLSKLWVQLKVYEDDLPWLRYGQDATFTSVALPGETFHGKISFIDPVLDKMTRTINVRLNVDNQEGKLKPGMYVRGSAISRLAMGGKVIDPSMEGKWICPMHPEIVKDGAGSCDICGMDLVPTGEMGFVKSTNDTPPLVIPVTAALVTGRRAVVYVALPEKDKPTYEGREVVLGARAGDKYIVAEGLAEGELVVTRGAFRIDSALQIIARPSVMNPEAGQMSGEHAGHTMDSGDMMNEMDMKMEPVEVTDAFREKLSPLYTAYFEIQQALAADDLINATKGMASLHERIKKIDRSASSKTAEDTFVNSLMTLDPIVSEGAKAATIEEARTHFNGISKSFISLNQDFGHSGGQTFYQVHCPMAFDFTGADWLQTMDKVRNPFFGSEMLECGTVEKIFPPGPAK